MVIVNTVVIVRGMGHPREDVTLALAAYGGGSMLVALLLPRMLRRIDDRRVMLAGSLILTCVLAALALAPLAWVTLLIGWLALGAGYALCVTPGGRLQRRSSG